MGDLVPVIVRDRIAAFERQVDEGSRFAIDASATRLVKRLQENFFDHYTSGAFRDTLKVRSAIGRSEPERVGPYEWNSRVGIVKGKPLPNPKPEQDKRYGVGEIALAWELGHYNIYMRRHVRVQIWAPTTRASREDLRETFARVFKRYLDRTPAGTTRTV